MDAVHERRGLKAAATLLCKIFEDTKCRCSAATSVAELPYLYETV